MNWRPWLVALALFAGGVATIALLLAEGIYVPPTVVSTTVRSEDPLGSLPPTVNARYDNFLAMGLPIDLAQSANKKATAILKDRSVAYKKLISENRGEAARIFCKDSRPPPRYQALSILITQDDTGKRRVREPIAVTSFDVQPWYAGAGVKDVYDSVEYADARKPDASIMGILALLIGKEEQAIQQTGPWGDGFIGGWSLDNAIDQSADQNPRVLITDYFALMHVFVELSNEEGICG